MAGFIIGNILGGVVDLTTSEELLGVGTGIKDDTKGGSYVDGLASRVKVNVLSRVCASVSIDIFKSI